MWPFKTDIFSLSIMHLKSIHAIAHVNNPFFFIAR